ncbi:MAG: desulfoferrodoxin [Candidatus Lokiarchaeota archaeon]|nr:desulfoferrodoxin [Candidatus Lokiarchaeota archaeon]
MINMIKDILHEKAEETQEKHVPHIAIDGTKVTVSCGKDIMHPSTKDHFIGWMKLYTVDNNGRTLEVGSSEPTASLAQPVACFTLTSVDNIKKLMAVIYCNIHGIWENELEL